MLIYVFRKFSNLSFFEVLNQYKKTFKDQTINLLIVRMTAGLIHIKIIIVAKNKAEILLWLHFLPSRYVFWIQITITLVDDLL